MLLRPAASALLRSFSPCHTLPLSLSLSSMASTPIFRQLFDKDSSTYTYLLADPATKEAVLIDPVIDNSERDAKLVKEMGLTLKFVMNTHVHADHITGTGRLKKLVPGCQSVLAKKAGAQADLMVIDGSKVEFGSQVLDIVETPGHTEGCITYIDRWELNTSHKSPNWMPGLVTNLFGPSLIVLKFHFLTLFQTKRPRLHR